MIDLTPPLSSPHQPTDLKEHLIQCFAQIKTTRSQSLKTSVKLSNAIKAAKSPNPTFIFLFSCKGKGLEPILYGRHIWKSEIERILKKAREAFVADPGRDPSKIKISFSFSEDDRVDDPPSEWIFDRIREQGLSSYTTSKLDFVHSVGYGELSHCGTFSIPGYVPVEDIVQHELGLIEHLPVEDFQLFDQRFGLPPLVPFQSIESGWISIYREPKKVVLKLISDVLRTFEISGTARIPQFIPPEDPRFALRIEAGGIDIVASPNQRMQKINFSINRVAPGPFNHKIGITCLLSWANNRKLRFEVCSEHGMLFGGEMKQVPVFEDWMEHHALVGCHLLDLMGAERTDTLMISHESFHRCVEDMNLAATLSSYPSSRLDGDFGDEIEDFSFLLGYAYTVVENWSVGAIYRLEHKTRCRSGGRQILYFSNPKTVQRYAFRQSLSEFRQFLVEEFERFRAGFDGRTATILHGDFVEWSRKNSGEDLISISVD